MTNGARVEDKLINIRLKQVDAMVVKGKSNRR